MKQTGLMTAEELQRLDIPGKVTELIRGQLIVREPPGARHGMIAASLCIILGTFVRREKLGAVFAQDTGFKIESHPDTCVRPMSRSCLRRAWVQLDAEGMQPSRPTLPRRSCHLMIERTKYSARLEPG